MGSHTMASSMKTTGGLLKWSESIAKISQQTEKNLAGVQGLMNSDDDMRDRSMTQRDPKQLSSERRHEEREMDLMERERSTDSLKKIIQKNNPGLIEAEQK